MEYNKESTEYKYYETRTEYTSWKKHPKEWKYVSLYQGSYGVPIPADKWTRETRSTDRIPADYHNKCTRETNIRLIESHSSNAQVHVQAPSWFYSRPRSGPNVPGVTLFDRQRKFLQYFYLICSLRVASLIVNK